MIGCSLTSIVSGPFDANHYIHLQVRLHLFAFAWPYRCLRPLILLRSWSYFALQFVRHRQVGDIPLRQQHRKLLRTSGTACECECECREHMLVMPFATQESFAFPTLPPRQSPVSAIRVLLHPSDRSFLFYNSMNPDQHRIHQIKHENRTPQNTFASPS
jgi:hypothetical protein